MTNDFKIEDIDTAECLCKAIMDASEGKQGLTPNVCDACFYDPNDYHSPDCEKC